MRNNFFIIVLSLSILLLSSCYSDNASDIRNEAIEISNYILNNLSNDNIKVDDVSCTEESIRIVLYGSDKAYDIIELLEITNQWLDDKEDSLVSCYDLMFTITLYLDRPTQSDIENMRYVAMIGNYDHDFSSDIGPTVDCVDINHCEELKTSMFGNIDYGLRVIMIPSNTEIDDFEVFVNMPSLEVLNVSDYPFYSDELLLEEKYHELLYEARNYDNISFNIGFV